MKILSSPAAVCMDDPRSTEDVFHNQSRNYRMCARAHCNCQRISMTITYVRISVTHIFLHYFLSSFFICSFLLILFTVDKEQSNKCWLNGWEKYREMKIDYNAEKCHGEHFNWCCLRLDMLLIFHQSDIAHTYSQLIETVGISNGIFCFFF